VREVLAGILVREFLAPGQKATILHPGDSLETVIDRLDTTFSAVLPVVDTQNQLLGVVDLEEVHLASGEPSLRSLVLAEDLMRTDVRPLTPNDTLAHAQELFVENDLLALPVVQDRQQRAFVGMVRRHDIATAYLRRVHGPAPLE
jgi:CBS domain-containing protein